MDHCVFCEIIRDNKILKVYEDNWTIAFMDIAKDVDGHILVVPKKHVKNILDCDIDTLNKLMRTVKTISNHLIDNCGYDGINLLNAGGESAGQSVPHFHFHVIPRKRNDGIDAWPEFKGGKQDIETLWNKVKIQF